MSDNELVWRIAGGSGDGIASTSQNFAKALMRSGLEVFTHRHYPSRIRGGHTYVEVRASTENVKSRGDGYNVLLALGDSFARNPDDDAYYGNEEVKPLSENLDDLREGGIIVYDEGLVDDDDVPDFEQRAEENDWDVYGMDLRAIANEHGREVMRNTAGVGVTAALIGMDLEPIIDVMSDSKMSGDVLETNETILRQAHDTVLEEYEQDNDVTVPEADDDDSKALITGSDGIAYGAIDAGCRFISGYPMTPWTDVFTIMSQNLPDMNGVAEQVEDEIAAASMAIGASHAGVKAMSGSSGGGFALMSEPLGLAEMTETPLVLVEAQRAGPSTGMPTKTEQADLEHVLYTSQGDTHRVVFAPANPSEGYEQTRLAFEIAYDYHLPVIVLYDSKLAGEMRNVDAEFFDREPAPDLGATLSEDEIAEAAHHHSGKFKRFRFDAEDGVSPRSIPGQKGGRFLATGNEHNEAGHITEDPDKRVMQVDRRLRKLDTIQSDLADRNVLQSHHGPEDADYGIITWGTAQGAVEEAVDRLNEAGHSVKSLGVGQITPFPEKEMTAFLDSVEEAIVVEMNASGQFHGHIKKELGDYGDMLSSLLKYNGNPFEPRDVVEGFEASIEGDTEVPGNKTRYVPATGD
ncbi:MAG: 2-oxoacid:acceptor oxidoreductase subunit alpha [Halobacteriales archaeon]